MYSLPPPTGVDLRNLNQPMSSLANNILLDLNTFETLLALSYYHTQGHRHHSPTVSADLIGRNASKTEAAIAFYQSDAMHELNMLISVWFAAIDPEAWFLYRAAYKAFVGGRPGLQALKYGDSPLNCFLGTYVLLNMR